jgi:hypothetical protein
MIIKMSSTTSVQLILKNLLFLMVFNVTFNNISAISWRSVLLMEETGGPGENHRPINYKVVHLALIEI